LYKQWVIQLAQKNDPELLDYFINKGINVSPSLLGYRRTKTLIIRSVPENSDVFNKYANDAIRANYNNIMKSFKLSKGKNKNNQILKDMICDLNDLDIKEYEVDNTDDGVIEFIKFDKARELIEIILQNIHDQISELNKECPICFEDVIDLKPLHNDIRHGVCISCSTKFNTCPFCRIHISINETI